MRKRRQVILCFIALFAFSLASADTPKNEKHLLTVEPANSPVKSTFAIFHLKTPKPITARRADYRIEATSAKQNSEILGQDKSIDLKSLSDGTFEAQVPASLLPVGKFKINFKVKPEKTLTQKAKDLVTHTDDGELRGEADFSIDPSLEVADPGRKGTLTLAGIDSDGDGIRDDIQRWINENYGSSPRMLAAAKQMARDSQTKLLSFKDKTKSIAMSRQVFDSMDCVRYVVGNKGEMEFGHQLEAKMENTRDRILARIQNSVNFNGQEIELSADRDLASKCRFNVNSLPK